jgi:hypothetical protein
MRKFLAQMVRTPALEGFNKLVHSKSGICRDKQMHVVWLNFKGYDFNASLFCYFFENTFKPVTDFSDENRLPPLGTPDKMVVNKENLIARIFIFHNVYSITFINGIVKRFLKIFQIFCRFISTAKAGGFLGFSCKNRKEDSVFYILKVV